MVHFFLKPFDLFGKLVDKTIITPSNRLLSTSPRFSTICPCTPEFPQSTASQTSNNTSVANGNNSDEAPPKYEDIFKTEPEEDNVQTGGTKGQINGIERRFQSLHVSESNLQNGQASGGENKQNISITKYENTTFGEGHSSSTCDTMPINTNCSNIFLSDRTIIKSKRIKHSERRHRHQFMSHYERRMEKKIQRANNKIERKARKLDKKMKALELKKQTILQIYDVPEQF